MTRIDVDQIMSEFDEAKSDRSSWETKWNEVDLFVAGRHDFLQSSSSPGRTRLLRAYDNTATFAWMNYASALHALLTNPAIVWFVLKLEGDSPENEDLETREFLAKSTMVLLWMFNSESSGFSTNIVETYQDEAAYGTGVMLPVESRGGIRFVTKPLSEMYLAENDDKVVDRVWRRFEMSNRQIVARFPEKMVPGVGAVGPGRDTIKNAANRRTGNDKQWIVHYTFERIERDPTKIDGVNKPFGSIYLEEKGGQILSVSGFDRMPYLTPRMEKMSDEVYGRSPAIRMMPTIKMLNAMARTDLSARELSVNPPWAAYADSIDGLRVRPGSINLIKAMGPRDNMPRPMLSGARLDFSERGIEMYRAAIDEAYYKNVLTLPEIDRMTAREVEERVQQKLQILSPIVSRQFSELLSPMVKWAFDVAQRKGWLPTPPQKLNGRRIDVEYQSPLALAQKSSDVTNVIRFIGAISPLAQVDSSAMDKVDVDRTVEFLHERMNVDPRTLRSDEEVQARREADAQAQQQVEQAQLAQASASAGKDATSALKNLSDAGIGV